MENLQPAVLQAATYSLSQLKSAQLQHKSSIQISGDSIPLSLDPSGICFATPSYSWYDSHWESSSLPVSLLETFKTCSVSKVERKLVLEALFLSNQFESASSLAKSLDQFCNALQEIIQVDIASLTTSDDNNTKCGGSYSPVLSLSRLKSVVALAKTFMQDLENFVLVGDDEHTQQPGPLHMASLVYSELSHNTLFSLKNKSHLLPEAADSNEQKAFQKHVLEELSLVLSLKDTVLSSYPPEGSDYATLVKLISDIFPSCDLSGLLMHEASIREDFEVKSREDKEAGESARESRAASAMQVVHEDHQPSEGKYSYLLVIACFHLISAINK